MKYQKRNVNGDAGEYLVAYTVTHKLGFPCRLYGVDIGVDAEMEIMDKSQHSTGDIIKIQIKTVDSIASDDHVAIYPEDKHIEYWKRFCLPVIICCVDLSKTKVYWKQITATEAYKSGGQSKKISFCLKEDILNENSISKLRLLACPPESKNIGALLDKLIINAEKIPDDTTEYLDLDSINKTKQLCHKIDTDLKEIESVISSFPWRVGSIDIGKINTIKSHLRVTKNNLLQYQNEFTY